MPNPSPTPASWPPSDEDLSWRPESYSFNESIDVQGRELPSLTLAEVHFESVLSDAVTVSAVAEAEGGYRILVADEYGTEFTPPVERATEPLSLGEMLRILDETTQSEQ